jgi:flavorubredoxin
LAADPSGAFFGAHSLVIRGREPVIVDTGCALVRDHWMAQVTALVDPADVRWIAVSHDDHDHVGNLLPLLEACPNATLIASFAIVARLAGDVELPIERMRWLDVGESIDIGDRTLAAVRPPMFDSPATRGFFDTSTGVLWAADAFGCLVPADGLEREQVPDDLYDATFTMLNSWNTPWMEWVDRRAFGAHLATTAELPTVAVASAHGPVLRDGAIADAYARTLALAGAPAVDRPGPELLDLLVEAVFGQAA